MSNLKQQEKLLYLWGKGKWWHVGKLTVGTVRLSL